jgi:hypothetical protein
VSDREQVRRSIESALEGIRDDLEIADPGVIAVSWRIASYSAPDGQVTTYNALGSDFCSARELLDVAGSGRTGRDGDVELSLNGFHCRDVPATAGGNTLGYQSPVNVVATSRSLTPVHLAVRARIGPGDGRPQDVLITVSSWDVSGNPLGGVPFFWRCQVPIVSIIG